MNGKANDENNVANLYKNDKIAKDYVEDRFFFSWQRLLHETQFKAVDNILTENDISEVLEIAPGPARIAYDLRNVKKGYMLEYSGEMIEVAKNRLQKKGKDGFWKIIHGNAFELDRIETDLPDNFHFIYTFRFIRHFRKEERKRIYNTLKLKLQSDGLLMFDVVNRKVRDKLDGKRPSKPNGSLNVFDERYTEQEFIKEMGENGFKVLSLKPVIKYFTAQSLISSKLYDILPQLDNTLVQWIEKLPSKFPLEWIAICQAVE